MAETVETLVTVAPMQEAQNRDQDDDDDQDAGAEADDEQLAV